MSDIPQISTTPQEIMNSTYREPPFLTKIWGPTIFGIMGLTSVFGANFVSRRPLLSGIQNHVIFTCLGIGIGKIIEDYRNDYLAERDAVFRHYIELHPEDFPPFNRQKYADILEPWCPIR